MIYKKCKVVQGLILSIELKLYHYQIHKYDELVVWSV